MNDELAEKLKYLRLGGLLAHWDDHLKMAAKKRLSHTRLLTHIIEEEYRIKRENACKLRLKRARIPEPFVMETFPFDRQPKLNRKMILALYDSLEYMRAGRKHHLARPHRLRQDGAGEQLSYPCHWPGAYRTLRVVRRVDQRTVSIRGGPLRDEGAQAIPVLRLPAH